jgi:hypothetical protein
MGKMICGNWHLSIAALLVTTVTRQSVASGPENGTLFVDRLIASCPVIGTMTMIGFSSESFGAYEPVRLTGGKTVDAIEDIHVSAITCGSSSAVFHASGFSSDPGKDWLISITCDGSDHLGAIASYLYDEPSGRASWAWSSLFGLTRAARITCKIIHA